MKLFNNRYRYTVRTVQTVCTMGVASLFGKKKNSELNFSLIYTPGHPSQSSGTRSRSGHLTNHISRHSFRGEDWALLRQWRQMTVPICATHTTFIVFFLFVFHALPVPYNVNFVLARSSVKDSKGSYSSSGSDL